MNRRAIAGFLMMVGVAVSWGAAEPVRVAANDPRVRYVGRFDASDVAGPRAAWSASAVSLTFEGRSLAVELADDGQNVWEVVADGKSRGAITLQRGAHTYPIFNNESAARHTVELVKRTEFGLGMTQVRGFALDEVATVLPTPERARRLWVIGDSISCGFGNEAAGPSERFSAATENAWLAYGAVAARAVEADYACLAWSGKKLWPDNSILDYFDVVVPDLAAARWDHAAWIPDVIVINLGTNDFGRDNPDRDGWVAAYGAFIARLRELYPEAPVYCAVGTMMNDEIPRGQKARTTILSYLDEVVTKANAAGGPAVRLIDFGVQDPANGIGAGWHPSAKTHAIMGAQLADQLRSDLGW